MIYELATKEEIQDIFTVVQKTITTIYPKYYPTEVVDFFCDHHNRGAIEKDIANGLVYVLRVNDKIVGTGSFVENHITRVYVLPECQKKGYGTFILQQIEAQIKETYEGNGALRVYLDASLPAAALYEKLGYITIKHEKYPVANGIILVYEIMEKTIR